MFDSQLSNDFDERFGLHPIIASVLSRFSRRRNRLLLIRAIAVTVVVFAFFLTAVALADYFFFLPELVRGGLSVSAYVLTAGIAWWTSLRLMGAGDPMRVARQIESVDPKFREDLLSAVELSNPEFANGSEEFRKRLQQTVSRRVAGLDVPTALPIRILKPWLIASSLVVSLGVFLFPVPHLQLGRRIARVMLPGVPIQRASLTQIKITQPEPASRFVAQGDAIAIMVRANDVRGMERLSDVVLEFRSEEETQSSIPMTARVNASSTVNTAAVGKVFAANLAVGSVPLHYRVRSGDAMTLWNTLTPRPRPRVQSFGKRYVFPAYSKLGERTEQSDHGDLEALSGTTAHLTVAFDQPVTDAVIKYGNRGIELPLTPVDENNKLYQVKIPIKTPGQYQIDAVSITSQLNSPFSPQYLISPQIDRKPIVRWGEEVKMTQLVSPLELVDLAATVTDDLPVENVFLEFVVSTHREKFQLPIEIENPAKEIELSWQWDLIDPTHQGKDADPIVKLSSGDIVEARLIAIDRGGKRAESKKLELLVVEEGFDSSRHDRMETLRITLEKIANWAERIKRHSGSLHQKLKQNDFVESQSISKEMIRELEKVDELMMALKKDVGAAAHLGAAGNLELVGRGMIRLGTTANRLDADLLDIAMRDQDSWRHERRHFVKELAHDSRRMTQLANQVEEFSRAIIGHELSVNVVADELALLSSIRLLMDAGRSVPVNRFPHYMNVASSRLDALVNLIDRNHKPLPESTSKHFDRWQAWGERWAVNLRDIEKQNLSFDEVQRRVEQFRQELKNQVRHSTLDGRIASMLQHSIRDLSKMVGFAGASLQHMQKGGELAHREVMQLEQEKNTDSIVRRQQTIGHLGGSYQKQYEQLIARLDSEESLHRSREYVDLQFAADINLFKRAIQAVAKDGYVDYQGTSAKQVHAELSQAFGVIESAHELEIFLREIVQLADDELDLVDRAATRIDHPARLERFYSGFQIPLAHLQYSGVSWVITKPIHDAPNGPGYRQAADRIIKRRWSDEALISGEGGLRRLGKAIKESMLPLKPRIVQARETIAKYVPSIAELAREAADKAEQAKTNRQAESNTNKLATPQEAVDAARDTMEALHDLANTAKITDQEQRELARDADAAAEQIRQAMQEVQQSQVESRMTSPTMDKKLDRLAESLRVTAEHFEKAEDDADLSQSRERLRQSEEDFGIKEELQERFERAQAMAEIAKKSPEELLRQLEEELKRSPPMQRELQKIADRTSSNVKQNLEQMAKDERLINQALEGSDAEILERKRRAAREMLLVTRDLQMLDLAILASVQQAQNWGNFQKERDTLDSLREKLRGAVQKANEMGGEKAPMEQMRSVARDMAAGMKEAEKQLEKVAQEASENRDEDLHRSDQNRKTARRQIRNTASNARRRQLDQSRQNRNEWARFENDAKRRSSNAQRRVRDVRRQIDELEQRFEKQKNHREVIQGQMDQARRRLRQATRDQEAAKQTRQYAQQRRKNADASRTQIESKPLPDLDDSNPAAELAEHFANEAQANLKEMRKRLGELSQEVDALDQLRSPASQANSLSQQQQRIANDVVGAAEDLRRSARHEQRLDEKLTWEQLERAATQIEDEASKASAEATSNLKAASENAEKSADASRGVKQAEESIRSAAENLGRMLAQDQANKEDSMDLPQQAAAEASTQRRSSPTLDAAGRKASELAKTLDELDRALNSQQPQANGRSSENGTDRSDESQGPDGQADRGQPNANTNQGASEQADGNQSASRQNAADASQTLQESMNQYAQDAARQRAQSIKTQEKGNQSAQIPGTQRGNSSRSGQNKAGKESDKPGEGRMPSGGSLDTSDISRLGENWGSLRSRQTENATQGNALNIPTQYRREIEAYFRAVAKRSGQESSVNQGDN